MDSKKTAQIALANPVAFETHAVACTPMPIANQQISEQSNEISQRRTAIIAIKNNGRILFINLCDVLTAVAQGNHVLLQCQSGSYRLCGSISAAAEELETYGFVRIHRSVLVNRSWVLEIRVSRTGGYVLRLRNGKEFTITRTYKKNLKSLAEVWLGNDTFLRK